MGNYGNVEQEVKALKVTSIEDLKRASQGELVELPPFSENVPFVARLKRPSMLSMVKRNKIPNELLTEANKLFAGGATAVASNTMDKSMMDNLFSILDLICEESFIEPKYSELKENGIELTDEQQLFIFGYTQRGVENLKSFRE